MPGGAAFVVLPFTFAFSLLTFHFQVYLQVLTRSSGPVFPPSGLCPGSKPGQQRLGDTGCVERHVGLPVAGVNRDQRQPGAARRRRCSAIARASSPAGATAAPISSTHTSSVDPPVLPACAHASTTASRSTRRTKRPSRRGPLPRENSLLFGAQRDVEPADLRLVVSAADRLDRAAQPVDRGLADELVAARAFFLELRSRRPRRLGLDRRRRGLAGRGRGRVSRRRGRRRRGRRAGRAARAIVFGAASVIRQDAIRLGQLRGALGRHRLELLPEVLDLVRVIARDLQAERALHLVGGRGRCDLEKPVIVFQEPTYFLNSATLPAGSSRRASRPLRSRRRFGARFGSVLRAQYGQ